jgi:hypothetical protein
MPYHTSLTSNGTCLKREGTGVVTGKEIIDAVIPPEDILSKLHGVTHSIIDYTQLEEMRISNQDLNSIIEKQNSLIELLGPLSVAVVAPSDLAFGVARMYEAMTRVPKWEIQVFRTMTHARAWLDSELQPA